MDIDGVLDTNGAIISGVPANRVPIDLRDCQPFFVLLSLFDQSQHHQDDSKHYNALVSGHHWGQSTLASMSADWVTGVANDDRDAFVTEARVRAGGAGGAGGGHRASAAAPTAATVPTALKKGGSLRYAHTLGGFRVILRRGQAVHLVSEVEKRDWKEVPTERTFDDLHGVCQRIAFIGCADIPKKTTPIDNFALFSGTMLDILSVLFNHGANIKFGAVIADALATGMAYFVKATEDKSLKQTDKCCGLVESRLSTSRSQEAERRPGPQQTAEKPYCLEVAVYHEGGGGQDPSSTPMADVPGHHEAHHAIDPGPGAGEDDPQMDQVVPADVDADANSASDDELAEREPDSHFARGTRRATFPPFEGRLRRHRHEALLLVRHTAPSTNQRERLATPFHAPR
ncbi:hypothetical protein Daus18300_010368 [Diaporthe australafricana]|uniref:Uncharacterized protein n=1 Tax=Diaporthe australafricana TaxID=127596 RepID=A0ABR3WAI1_9PEZI